MFSIHHQIGVKLLTRLRLKFSHLSNLKFRHKFNDCLTPLINRGTEIEFLLCQFFASERHDLHGKICPWRPLIDPSVISFDGSDEFNDKIIKEILLCIVALGDTVLTF